MVVNSAGQYTGFVNVLGAARICGVSKDTIRHWARCGKLRFVTINDRGDRRFLVQDLYTVMGFDTKGHYGCADENLVVRVALYVRVSGTTGQDSSLISQQEQLSDYVLQTYSDGIIMSVFKDKASGLNQNRPGLTRMLKSAKAKEFDVLIVTHKDRLARFGVNFLEELLNAYGVSLIVVNATVKPDGVQELVEDFVSLVACFSGRIYGQRSAANRKRLLAKAQKVNKADLLQNSSTGTDDNNDDSGGNSTDNANTNANANANDNATADDGGGVLCVG